MTRNLQAIEAEKIGFRATLKEKEEENKIQKMNQRRRKKKM